LVKLTSEIQKNAFASECKPLPLHINTRISWFKTRGLKAYTYKEPEGRRDNNGCIPCGV